MLSFREDYKNACHGYESNRFSFQGQLDSKPIWDRAHRADPKRDSNKTGCIRLYTVVLRGSRRMHEDRSVH
jgi:hypothetical protein